MSRRLNSLLLCLLVCSYRWARCTASGTDPQPAPQPSGSACPQSWTLSEGDCFKLFKGTKTFSSAAQRCAELPVRQATLAKISSAEQSQAVAALVGKSDVSFAWIGLRITLQAPTTTTTTIFYLMQKGSCCCPEEDRISTMAECEAAFDALGLPLSNPCNGNCGHIPGGCSTSFGSSNTKDLHWNTQEPGQARDDMTPVCMKTTTTTTRACASIAGGGWTLVRHTASSGGWGPWNDDLDGMVTHGSPGNNISQDHWTIPWDSSTKSQYLFALGDCSQWLIADKTALDGNYEDSQRTILKSSSSNTSYTARWYNRASSSIDPWISRQDHHSCSHNCMLYGEDSSPLHTGAKNGHGGANVYVRQPIPVSAGRRQAEEASSSGAQCCYYNGCASYGTSSCGAVGSWCSQSAERCSGCGGTFCTAKDCYMSKSKYVPTDMSGQGRTNENSATDCQKRCASVTGCAHFSWWFDGGCLIQDSDASLATDDAATAGPPTCNQAGSYKLSWTDGSDLAFVASSYSPLHPGQECAMMNTSKVQEGTWSHSQCDTARPFLCSMPARITTEVDTLNMTNMTGVTSTTIGPITTHLIRYGHPNFKPLQMCQPDNMTADVRCCPWWTNSSKVDMSTYGCHESRDFNEATSICERHGLRLCTSMEIEECRTCDTGCNFTHRLVWTSTVCHTPGPVPTIPSTEDVDAASDDSDATSTTIEMSTTRTAVSSRIATDSPIGRIAARVEEEEASLRNQLLSSSQTQVTVSTKGATISVQKLDISLVSNSTTSIPVTVENTTAEVLVPVSLLKTFGRPVVLQVTAFEDVPEAAEGDQDVRGMVSVNLFDFAGGPLQVKNSTDEIVIKLPVNATEGRVCAYWDENQRNWSTEGLRQLSSSPGSPLVCSTSHLTLFGAIARGFERAMACSQGHLFSEMGFRELLKGKWYQHTAVVIIWCMLFFILLMLLVAGYLDMRRADDGVWDDSVFIVLTGSAIVPSTPSSLAEALAETGGEVCCIGRCCARLRAFVREYIWPVIDPLWQEVVGNLGDVFSLMVDFVGALRELLLEEEKTEMEDGSEVAEHEPRRRCLCLCRCRCCCKLSLGWRTLLNGGQTKALLTVVKLQASTRLMMSVSDVQLLFEKAAAEAAKNKTVSFEEDEAVTAECNSSVDKPPVDRQWSKREVILSRKERRLRETIPDVLTQCCSCQSLPRTLWQIFVAKNPWLSVLHSSISQPAVLSVLLSASLWLGDMAVIALFFSTDPSSSFSKRSNRSSECKHDGIFESFGAIIAVSIWSSLAAMVPCWILGTLHRRSFIEFDMANSDAYHRQIRIWRRRDRVLFVVSSLYCATCLLFVMTFHAHVTEADGIKWLYSVLFSVGSEFLVVPLVIAMLLGCSAHLAARRRIILQQAASKLGCKALVGEQEDAESETATKDSAQQEDVVKTTVNSESVCLDVKEKAALSALELPGALPDDDGVIHSAGDAEVLLEKSVGAGTLEMKKVHQALQQSLEGETGAGDSIQQRNAEVNIVNGCEEVTDRAGDAAASPKSARAVVAEEAPSHPESLLKKTVEAIDTDHDGSLDVEEVRKALQQSAQWSNMTQEEKDSVKASFALIDTDSSGNIELHELKTALQALGIDEAQAEMIFHDTDMNGNMKINLIEFLALVT